jgi:transcriptional regulator with XRE-family HTH domain
VTPDDIRALRKELSCTAKELAGVLDVDQATVMAWERADRFPTKVHVDRMEALRAKGPGAIPRRAKASVKGTNAASDPVKTLADPAFWELVRKIAAHKALRDEVAKIAEAYPDPARD